MRVLRWVLVLPGAIAAGYVAWFTVTFLNRLTMRLYVDPDGFLGRAYLETISNMVMGAAAVYVGARIAPSEQSKVALALTVLVILAAGVLLFPALQSRSWWAVYAVACLVAGAGSVTWSIYRGEDLGFAE